MKGQSRLRAWLLRGCAVLAVLAVLLAIAFRPLVSWIGGACDPTPGPIAERLSPAARALLDETLRDIDPARRVDHHVHVVGVGTGGSDCSVHPKMFSWLHPWQRLQLAVYIDAAGVDDLARADEQYIERLTERIRADDRRGRYCLLAFEQNFRPDGTVDREQTELYVPNDYVVALAERHPDVFVPVISLHPLRPDALAELDRFGARGVRIVKWLPNAMGIDPADPRCDPFYARMKRWDMTLLSHAGDEVAVDASGAQELGNPLRLRRALDAGVRVIVAHCASLGRGVDLDDAAGEKVDNFDLFLRMMGEERYLGLLFGEISAVCATNRPARVLATLLERSDLQPRLVDGSDYPLPAINVLFSTRKLERAGFLTADERRLLNEIYEFEPLLFDLALKRTVRHPVSGARFPAALFEERFPISNR